MNRREMIEKMAATDFAVHELTGHYDPETKLGHFVCRSPGSWVYGFYVMLAPGTIVVIGDLGELIFKIHGSDNQIKWLRGAIESPDYLFEKVPTDYFKKQEYCKDAAVAGIREYLIEDILGQYDGDEKPERARLEGLGTDKLLDLFATIDEVTAVQYWGFYDDWYDKDNEHDFCRAWSDNLGGLHDWPSFPWLFTPHLWWIREALRTFVRLYTELKAVQDAIPEKPQPPELEFRKESDTSG